MGVRQGSGRSIPPVAQDNSATVMAFCNTDDIANPQLSTHLQQAMHAIWVYLCAPLRVSFTHLSMAVEQGGFYVAVERRTKAPWSRID